MVMVDGCVFDEVLCPSERLCIYVCLSLIPCRTISILHNMNRGAVSLLAENDDLTAAHLACR
jgi:hypothetical protein